MCGSKCASDNVVAAGNSNFFGYVFGAYPTTWKFSGLGATHLAELPFLYGQISGLNVTMSDQEIDFSRKLFMKYWSNFAKTGNPNSEGIPVWEPYKASTMYFPEDLASRPGPLSKDMSSNLWYMCPNICSKLLGSSFRITCG